MHPSINPLKHASPYTILPLSLDDIASNVSPSHTYLSMPTLAPNEDLSKYPTIPAIAENAYQRYYIRIHIDVQCLINIEWMINIEWKMLECLVTHVIHTRDESFELIKVPVCSDRLQSQTLQQRSPLSTVLSCCHKHVQYSLSIRVTTGLVLSTWKNHHRAKLRC
jgi:hypothetical protein